MWEVAVNQMLCYESCLRNEWYLTQYISVDVIFD